MPTRVSQKPKLPVKTRERPKPGVLSVPGSSVSGREGTFATDARPTTPVPYSRADVPAGSLRPPRR
jgi:hypothetical protein